MLRTSILTMLPAAFLFAAGFAVAQPPKPVEPPPKPKPTQPIPVDPKSAEAEGLKALQRQLELRVRELSAQPKAGVIVIQEHGSRVVMQARTPAHAVPYCCPVEPRCGFLARLFGRCGGCNNPCRTPPPVAYCCCVPMHYPPPGQLYRIHLELNPQPLPPGAPAPKKLPRTITPERTSASLYQEAVSFYRIGDMAVALDLLTAAVERDSQDAAIWYYKALAEQAMGDVAEAKESARRGAACELLNHDGVAQLGLALERIQGDDRRFLRSMSADLTVESARQIAAAPVKTKRAIATK